MMLSQNGLKVNFYLVPKSSVSDNSPYTMHPCIHHKLPQRLFQFTFVVQFCHKKLAHFVEKGEKIVLHFNTGLTDCRCLKLVKV